MLRDNLLRLRRDIRLGNAIIESWFSTNAFKLLFLLLYIAANVLILTWGVVDDYHYTKSKYANHSTQKVFNSTERSGGFTLNFNCAIIMLLACRLLVTGIRKTPLYKVLPLNKCFPRAHGLVGCFIGLGVAIHFPVPLVRIFMMNEWDTISWWSNSMSFWTRVSLLVLFVILGVLSMTWFRNNHFHIFYNVHTFGSLVFFVLLLLHGVHKKHPYTYTFILPGLVLYTLDTIWRYHQMSTIELELSGRCAISNPETFSNYLF